MVNFPLPGRAGRSEVRAGAGVAAAVRGDGEAAAARCRRAARVRPESCSGLVEAVRAGGRCASAGRGAGEVEAAGEAARYEERRDAVLTAIKTLPL